MSATSAWYRQFWPWFVMAFPAAAIAGCLVTIWIAVVAAPERVDHAGADAVSISFHAGRIEFTPPAVLQEQQPAELELTVRDSLTGQQWSRVATRMSPTRYSVRIPSLAAGAYDVALGRPGDRPTVSGHWAYPAPVWKLGRTHD